MVQSAWTSGPRTPAWDALWKQILADIALSEEDTGPVQTGADEEHREEIWGLEGGRDDHSTSLDIRPDPAEVRRALDLLLSPGQVTELRALGVSTPEYRRPHTVSGYFDDPDALAHAAANSNTYGSKQEDMSTYCCWPRRGRAPPDRRSSRSRCAGGGTRASRHPGLAVR